MAQGSDCGGIQWRVSRQSPCLFPAPMSEYAPQEIRSISRAIIVDHDAATTELIAELLTSVGIVSLGCSIGALSSAFIEQTQAHLLILEFGLGDPSPTLALLGELRRNAPTRALPVIVNSTDDQMLARLAEPLSDLGCIVLAKPFELDDFFLSICLCLNIAQQHTAARLLTE